MMRVFLLVFVLAGATPGVAVVGTVRDGASGDPIAFARIELLDGSVATWTDSAGAYALMVPRAGTHRIRVSRMGYESRLLEVLTGSDSVVRVDVALVAKPERLPQIAVWGTRRTPASGQRSGEALDFAEPGARTLQGDELRGNPALSAPDALRPLTTIPFVAALPESPTSLQVRGGSSDQNLMLVDDVPVYNLSHAANALAALDPDVVSSVTVHAGVPPARYGGAASSVIAMRTEDVRRGGFTSRGALGPSDVRQMVAGRLARSGGSFLFAGRRSIRGLDVLASNQGNRAADFGDWFGKMSAPVGRGTIEILALGSTDRVAFDARIDANAAGEAAGGAEADATPPAATPRNAFQWSSRMQAAIWRLGTTARPHALVRVWRTEADAAADWRAPSGRARLASAFVHQGVGAFAVWQLAAAELTAGMDVERQQASYGVTVGQASIGSLPGARSGVPEPSRTPAPWLASAFLEGRWKWGDRWTLVGGAREDLASTVGTRIQPRLSLRFSPNARVALLAGYARTRQSTQSLRNDESLVDGVIGISFPVASGPGGLPRVQADQITAALELEAASGTVVSLEGYSRRLQGLALTAAATGQPFATDGIARGTGRASGVGLSVTRTGRRISGHVSYALATTVRESARRQYRPWYDVRNTLTGAVAYRPTPALSIGAALTAAGGRPTSVSSGDVEWAPAALGSGSGELAGSPSLAGSPGTARLAPYLRVDIGARYAWHPKVLGMGGALATTVSVSNLFDRVNELGIVQAGDGSRRTLPQQPRAVWLGVEWSR